MRRVIATQRNFVFGSGFRKLAVFCPNLIRCCVRSAVGTHPCARRLSVALRSQGRSLSVLLPFSFPDRHSAKRDGGLLLPHPRGDRPPGNVPDGMSKIKFHSFPRNYRALYQNAARESSGVHRARQKEAKGSELIDTALLIQ